MAVKENGILLEGNPEVTGDAKREINKILSAVEKNKKEIRIKNQGRCKLFIAGRGEDLVRSVEHKVACAIQVKKQGKFSERRDTRGLSTARTIREKPSSNILEKNGKKITVKQGDISNERVDVIVNSISGDMESPFKGGISQAIFSKAGNDLLTATQALGTMQVGDVKSTVSGRLKCREVYHCVLDKYYGGKGKRILRSVVKEVLNQASQSKFTSIAFPSLGTGYLGFPPQQVAEVMFQEALHFANKHKYSSLKDIRFIVFNAESVDAFQGEIGLYHDVDNDHTISHHASGLQSSEGKTHATFGKITLDLKQGDLTKESVDAIVNPVIPNTYEQSQVGIAIIRAGGNDIMREYERSKHDLSTGPIITGSGNLRNINNIIHIVCPKAHDLKRSVEKCLSLAENCLMSSVALPAIGSGHFGLSPAESASGIIEGVKHFAITSPQTLKTVKVVVFQAEMMSDFAKKLGQISQDGRPSDGRSRDGNAQTRPSYPQQGPPQVTITIFADNGGDLAQAEREINKILDEEVITDYIVDDSISKLKDEEFKQVKAIGTTSHVDVSMDTVDGSGNLPDILNMLRVSIVGQKKVLRLEGLKIDVATYKTRIHNWLDKLSAAKETQKTVHWYYFDGRKRQEFPALWNFDLETARLMRNTRMELLGEDGNPVYRVDLDAMRETHIKTHRKFIIQREGPDDSSVKYPKTWDKFPHKHKDNEPYRVTLSHTSKEYKTVEADFLQKSGTSNLTVQQIERIQHELQYQIYSLRRKALTQKYPKQEIEKTLYHGTKADSVDPIIRRGFNRSYAGSSVGAWEGQGAYFAVRSQYSLKTYYSPVDPNTGNRFMFQVKVLVGKTCLGKKGIVEPDLIPGTNDRYDTTTDNISNPNMFVTFHDEQAYPEYLITFK
ncbi:protein mono-ADP-ribosyltransferase PARP14-like [Ptychodera flava]|uniref:protein mono-ADP-ribosyltransferase PARP14-like n=1 Tax=Ptychodera flava TaxID=63121 RepID=UPI003969F549